MTSKKIDPFRHEYFLGYINQVFPQFVRVHFPSSVLLNGFTHHGKEFNGGLVGAFVVIEGERNGYLGRITELSLPESERLSLNEKAFQTSDFHPTGKVEILLSFDLYEPLTVKKGLTSYPHIGAKVFVSSGELVQEYMSRFGAPKGEKPNTVTLGTLVSNPDTTVKVNLQSIFGRHCAVVGTTGGGKSYTVSKLIESLIATGNKAILIDATGEYDGAYDGLVENVDIGNGTHVLHYSQLTLDDLIYMLKPSPRTQTPKLMEAMRSLKMVKIAGGEDLVSRTLRVKVEDGLLKKAHATKRPYEVCYFRNVEQIENGIAEFDFTKLSAQITEECVWDDGDKWGRPNDTDKSHCVSLLSRINNLSNTKDFDDIFGFKREKDENDISKLIDSFLKTSSDKKLLRLNLGDVKFEFQIREILANSIAKILLSKARTGEFKSSQPIILVVDEAHQFLNKTISDEYFDSKPLDAFDSIAKECRKHGLFLCIATQMPRDIPRGTLSQMGTFIVHRLINHNDKEAITNACSSANRNTLDFLPVLGEGEAILTGVDFPMPIIMKFDMPENPPNSGTPSLK
jgi:hypothetical protein